MVVVGGLNVTLVFCFGPKLKFCSFDLDLDQAEQKMKTSADAQQRLWPHSSMVVTYMAIWSHQYKHKFLMRGLTVIWRIPDIIGLSIKIELS